MKGGIELMGSGEVLEALRERGLVIAEATLHRMAVRREVLPVGRVAGRRLWSPRVVEQILKLRGVETEPAEAQQVAG